MSVVKLSIVLAAAAWHESAAPVNVPVLQTPPIQQRGLASWYGDGRMHGRRTASGDEIDAALHTCAHRSLPLQTTVLLVNPADRSLRAWCRVNDRGPYGARTAGGDYVVKTSSSQPGRWRGVLDVSVAAAKQLGTHEKGLEPIEIYYWSAPRDRGAVAQRRKHRRNSR